jgi:hypothetical protein
MKKIIKWLNTSNRGKHLLGGIAVGFLSKTVYTALYAGLGVASALEFKDKLWGGKWDWIDWIMTVVGVIIGQMLLYQGVRYLCLGSINWGVSLQDFFSL